MPSPKDSEHDDARDKGRHILESGQERFDIVRDLLRGDHQHRDCEGKGCVDKGFQPRHLHTAQTKSAEPRQRIQLRRQRGCYLFLSLVHLPVDTTAILGWVCRGIFTAALPLSQLSVLRSLNSDH